MKGTAALLQYVWVAHASGGDHQTSPDGMVQLEYTDEVVEKRHGDSGKVHRVDLQRGMTGRSVSRG